MDHKNNSEVMQNGPVSMEDDLNDVSLYGEFVSTFHHWVSSEEQKGKAAALQNLGKTNK